MKIEIYVQPIDIRLHNPQSENNAELLKEIKKIFSFLVNLKGDIMSALTDLQAAVAAQTTVTASAIVLLQGLKAALDEAIANGSNPAELVALSTTLGTDTASLAAAITANTPTPPAPPVP